MNWQTELRQALTTTEQLQFFFNHPFPQTNFPILITERLAHMIKTAGINSPLGLQFLPTSEENNTAGLIDPIGDLTCYQGGGLIHRYANRALLLPTSRCPVHCRYCFRRNHLDQGELFEQNWEQTSNYLQQHPEINEIILTGGDPFILSDQKLFSLLENIAMIDSIKVIRFHTRCLTTLPSRFTAEFLAGLKQFQKRFNPVVLVFHINHISELDDEAKEVAATIPFLKLSQSVLLKNVNDHVDALVDLFQGVFTCGIQPYYLHHPDKVAGGMHFSLATDEGRRLFQEVRQQVSGWCLPRYVIDNDEGEGKKQL